MKIVALQHESPAESKTSLLNEVEAIVSTAANRVREKKIADPLSQIGDLFYLMLNS
jgi:hypothetical protein